MKQEHRPLGSIAPGFWCFPKFKAGGGKDEALKFSGGQPGRRCTQYLCRNLPTLVFATLNFQLSILQHGSEF